MTSCFGTLTEEALLYGKGPLADVLGMNRTGMYGKGIVEELLGENEND
jgi:hypothetical protein